MTSPTFVKVARVFFFSLHQKAATRLGVRAWSIDGNSLTGLSSDVYSEGMPLSTNFSRLILLKGYLVFFSIVRYFLLFKYLVI